MAKLTKKQWSKARAFYEIGNSGNATAKKFNVSRRSVQLRVISEKWNQNLDGIIAKKAADKVAGLVNGYNFADTEEVIDNESSKRAFIELRHRDEPGHVRLLLYNSIKHLKESKSGVERKLAMDDLKASKLAVEVMKGIQEMERKSYRLDTAPVASTNFVKIERVIID